MSDSEGNICPSKTESKCPSRLSGQQTQSADPHKIAANLYSKPPRFEHNRLHATRQAFGSYLGTCPMPGLAMAHHSVMLATARKNGTTRQNIIDLEDEAGEDTH